MHSCPGNHVSIGRAVVYYARAAHTLSAGIKCWHCRVRTPLKSVERGSNDLEFFHTDMSFLGSHTLHM